MSGFVFQIRTFYSFKNTLICEQLLKFSKTA